MRLITEIRRRERRFSRMFMGALEITAGERKREKDGAGAKGKQREGKGRKGIDTRMWISINRSPWKPVAGGSPLLHRALIIRFYSSRLPTPVSRRLRPSRPRCSLLGFLFLPSVYNPSPDLGLTTPVPRFSGNPRLSVASRRVAPRGFFPGRKFRDPIEQRPARARLF